MNAPKLVVRIAVEHPGERAAGIHPYSEDVEVQVGTDPGGEPGEFAEFLVSALSDWFDGAHVMEWKPGVPRPGSGCFCDGKGCPQDCRGQCWGDGDVFALVERRTLKGDVEVDEQVIRGLCGRCAEGKEVVEHTE